MPRAESGFGEEREKQRRGHEREYEPEALRGNLDWLAADRRDRGVPHLPRLLHSCASRRAADPCICRSWNRAPFFFASEVRAAKSALGFSRFRDLCAPDDESDLAGRLSHGQYRSSVADENFVGASEPAFF